MMMLWLAVMKATDDRRLSKRDFWVCVVKKVHDDAGVNGAPRHNSKMERGRIVGPIGESNESSISNRLVVNLSLQP